MVFIYDDSDIKPIKVVFEDGPNPCPIKPFIRCDCSKIKYDNMDIIIYCNRLHCKYQEELI